MRTTCRKFVIVIDFQPRVWQFHRMRGVEFNAIAVHTVGPGRAAIVVGIVCGFALVPGAIQGIR